MNFARRERKRQQRTEPQDLISWYGVHSDRLAVPLDTLPQPHGLEKLEPVRMFDQILF
jgi:hypothetical protein